MSDTTKLEDAAEGGLRTTALFAEPLLAEYVDEGNWGNFALCGRCGDRCGRDSGCPTCDGTAEVDGEKCEDCLDGERWWCDRCGEIEGWLPKGQCAPAKSSANEKLRDGGLRTPTST